jgi:hypothetical protein
MRPQRRAPIARSAVLLGSLSGVCRGTETAIGGRCVHSDTSAPPKSHRRPFKSISPKSGSKFPKEINSEKTPILGFGAAPINLLGGYRWPGASSIDRKTLRKIIRAEVGEAPPQ